MEVPPRTALAWLGLSLPWVLPRWQRVQQRARLRREQAPPSFLQLLARVPDLVPVLELVQEPVLELVLEPALASPPPWRVRQAWLVPEAMQPGLALVALLPLLLILRNPW